MTEYVFFTNSCLKIKFNNLLINVKLISGNIS